MSLEVAVYLHVNVLRSTFDMWHYKNLYLSVQAGRQYLWWNRWSWHVWGQAVEAVGGPVHTTAGSAWYSSLGHSPTPMLLELRCSVIYVRQAVFCSRFPQSLHCVAKVRRLFCAHAQTHVADVYKWLHGAAGVLHSLLFWHVIGVPPLWLRQQ
jgi:hypothetical protein